MLAHEFEKFVSTSKDVHIFPHNFSSFSQLTSPMFDVEKNIESKKSLSNFGGAYDNTSNVCAHDDFVDARDLFEGKFATISMFSPIGGCTKICFDTLDEQENIENPIADSEIPFYTEKSCNNTFDDLKFLSNSLLDEEKDYNQHVLDQHFQKKKKIW